MNNKTTYALLGAAAIAGAIWYSKNKKDTISDALISVGGLLLATYFLKESN